MLNVQFSHANVTMKGRVQKKNKISLRRYSKWKKERGEIFFHFEYLP